MPFVRDHLQEQTNTIQADLSDETVDGYPTASSQSEPVARLIGSIGRPAKISKIE
nr:hypothetical protein [uncultured Agathobaculum sp.]